MSSQTGSRVTPAEHRKRSSMSCDYCRQRRCKCIKPDSNASCQKCEEHGIECSFSKPRKSRIYGSMEGLDARYRVMETLVHGLFPDQPLAQTSDMIALGTALGLDMPKMEESQGRLTIVHAAAARTMRSRRLLRLLLSGDNRPALNLKAEEKYLHDAIGRERYIGPAGSFWMINTLRTLISQKDAQADFVKDELAITFEDCLRLSDIQPKVDLNMPSREDADALIDSYFSQSHIDYPVFHRASFQMDYEAMWSPRPNTDPSWLCSLYMVFVLGRPERDSNLFNKAQGLLPQILCTPKLGSVQALLLLGLYFHMTNERNACWTMVGAAVRIAFAIGLHRQSQDLAFNAFERHIRKRVWWTLYELERFLCLSLGRPSAIDDTQCDMDLPSEAILGNEGKPPSYSEYSALLAKLEGEVCKGMDNPNDDVTANLVGRLSAWRSSLPSHLHCESSMAPIYRRPIVLLHVRYYYLVSLLTRSDVLQNGVYAEECMNAAFTSSRLLQSLQPEFVCGIEVFYMYSCIMVLALGVLTGRSGVLMEEIHACLAILDSVELWGTMARFGNVSRDLAKAVSPSESMEQEQTPPDLERIVPAMTWDDLSSMLLGSDDLDQLFYNRSN